MATAQIEARLKASGGAVKPRNTRRNEIVAIALFAVGPLMALCLVSYNPNDPSWVSVGATVARNWTGRVGATVLLSAVAAVALLLATNFSFVSAYERTASALANPSGAFRKSVERFRAWRAARRTHVLARAEARREARAARARESEAQRLAAQPAAAANAEQPAPTIAAKR